MKPVKVLQALIQFSPTQKIPLGRLAVTSHGIVHFEYDQHFLDGPLAPSPFKLPVQSGAFTPQEPKLFDGLFGLFADSLPDGWGLLLMDRAFSKMGLSLASSSPLDRLAYVGARGMGALVYEPPADNVAAGESYLELSALATEAEKILHGKSEDVLDELLNAGGSPGGARPKVIVGVRLDSHGLIQELVSGTGDVPDGFEHWLIKFRGKNDHPEDGLVEYAYSLTAQKAQLAMEPTNLFQGRDGQRWFGTRRFDRLPGNLRLHAHTLSGLLHANFRFPSIDYETFLRATSVLTRHHQDLLMAFRLAIFNVVFHNRDDHAKNFSFLMDSHGVWRLAPAYDLTFAFGPGGEHSTSVLGEGKNPSTSDLLRLAKLTGIEEKDARRIIEEVQDAKPFLARTLRELGVRAHPAVKEMTAT